MLLNTPKHAHAVAGKRTWRRLQTMLFVLLAGIAFASCEKFVEVPTPSTALTSESVFQSNKTAVAAVNGLYINLGSGDIVGGNTSIPYTTALLSDELFLYPGATDNARNIFDNNVMSTNVFGLPWRSIYTYLQNTNAILLGLDKSDVLNDQLKHQLRGECLFLRAYCYFYLTTLYGDVPLLLTPDWKINTSARRTSANEVWNQIIKDLKDAQELLSEDYLMADALTKYPISTAERVRPTKWAAHALLSRVYLYNQKWENAETEANQVLSQTEKYNLEFDLTKVFLKNSKEAIWQLMPVIPGYNTTDATTLVLTTNGFSSVNPAYIPTIFYNDFKENDKRRSSWIGSVTINNVQYYFPYKYKVITYNAPVTEYQMIFRLSEQYLIRAEARAKLGKISDGVDDLNKIRNRAGLSDTTINNDIDLFNAIVHERRLELFTEWGHRWLDLKRWGIIDEVMKHVTPIKSNGKEWRSFQQLMPIELADIQVNPNLLPNNPGY